MLDMGLAVIADMRPQAGGSRRPGLPAEDAHYQLIIWALSTTEGSAAVIAFRCHSDTRPPNRKRVTRLSPGGVLSVSSPGLFFDRNARGVDPRETSTRVG